MVEHRATAWRGRYLRLVSTNIFLKNSSWPGGHNVKMDLVRSQGQAGGMRDAMTRRMQRTETSFKEEEREAGQKE